MQIQPVKSLRSKLGDQLINDGPYTRGDWNPFMGEVITAEGLNELRDELMRLRGVPGDPQEN